jgi:hypothetical protein
MGRKRKLLWTVVILVALTACTSTPTATKEKAVSPTDTPVPAEAPAEPTPTEPEPTPTEAPPTDTPEPTPVEEGLPRLPADPQQIAFQAGDGQQLVGMYYPAAVNPAPAVVLMHWAPGDQNDWPEIAKWLQNRGASTGSGQSGTPWLDPSWFPPMLEGLSFAVFTFTFRGCEGGCSSFEPAGWLLDAQAAVETTKGLEGVDPSWLVAIGASIGADGAIDACGEGCLGGLSLSPGSYLGVPYAEAVTALGEEEPAKPAWCLAAEGDRESAPTCRSAEGDHYRMIIYPSTDHGMQLIRPETDPETLGVILEFLQLAFGL